MTREEPGLPMHRIYGLCDIVLVGRNPCNPGILRYLVVGRSISGCPSIHPTGKPPGPPSESASDPPSPRARAVVQCARAREGVETGSA